MCGHLSLGSDVLAGNALRVRRGFSLARCWGVAEGKGDEFHPATGASLGAPGGGDLVEGEQEVPLMQALGAGRQGERSLPFACCAWWVPWEPRAGCVQYFCRQGKTGNAVEGQPGRAGTAHPPAAGTT